MSDPVTSMREAGVKVVRTLREAGYEALWAGGCVRDMLLGGHPKDFDVATSATPEQVMALFRRTRAVGVQFGVVLVRIGGHWLETATFRTDLSYKDGRRPEGVIFTNAQEDAKRRDFTINGLFFDPLEERVIDFVGGRQDMAAGVIRAIGEPAARFAEDHLRLLRAIRFSTRLGFVIEPATAAAIREHAALITRISRERIREELEKMLAHPSRGQAVRMIADFGLLEHVWPGTTWSAGQLERACRALQALPEQTGFEAAMAAWLHEFPLNEIHRIGRELRCSNRHIADVGWLVEHVDSIELAEALCLPAFKGLIAHGGFDDLLQVHAAVCAARGRSADAGEFAWRRRDEIPPDQVAPPPLVSGNDLRRLGLRPGPRFKRILDALYDEQLDNRLTDRRQALARLADLASGKARPGH